MKTNKNPLDVVVNYCNNHKDQNPTEVNLFKFLTDGRFRDLVQALRSESNPNKQQILKDILPACMVSGLFRNRNVDSLISATNLICIDIDEKDNTHLTDFGTLKEHIRECPLCIVLCSLSTRQGLLLHH